MAQIVLENQFGEVSINQVIDGTDLPDLGPIANNTMLGNFSGGSALAAAYTNQAVANKLPSKAGVTAITALATPVTAITITLSTGDTYTDAAVKAAVDAALVTVVADLQSQLTQMNTILAQLKVSS